MRVAVIGAGRMGRIHARFLAACGIDELLVADVEPERARAVAREFGGIALDEPEAAVERADAVVVATPPASHAALVEAAIERRLPVLCEKPLAVDLPAAVRLARLAEARGASVYVAFQRRFDPAFRAAHDLVRSGRLGQLYLLRLQGTEPVTPRSPKTNLLRNTAIHDFDAVRWLSGQEVVSVYAEGSERRGGEFDPRTDPDTVVVTLRLGDGSLAAVSVSRLSALGYDVRLELVGSRDHVSAGWTGRTPVHSLEDTGPRSEQPSWQDWQSRFEIAYRNEVTAFVASIREGRPAPAAGAHDGLAAQRIAEAARRSLVEGRRVDVGE